jgi:hypothetical protein
MRLNPKNTLPPKRRTAMKQNKSRRELGERLLWIPKPGKRSREKAALPFHETNSIWLKLDEKEASPFQKTANTWPELGEKGARPPDEPGQQLTLPYAQILPLRFLGRPPWDRGQKQRSLG